MSIKWSDNENTSFISLLEDGVSLVSLQKSLPLRSLSAIATRASAAGYRTETVEGEKRLLKGIKRRTRVAKLSTSEANTRIKIKEADELIATTNSDTSAAVECIENTSTEIIPSLNSKTNKEYKMVSENINTKTHFRLEIGAGYTKEYKIVDNIMNYLEQDLARHISIAYGTLEKNSSVSRYHIELFESIAFDVHKEISSFIDEYSKCLPDVCKEDFNIYLQPFFNYILETIDLLDSKNNLYCEYEDLLSLIFIESLYHWVLEQRRLDYKDINRFQVSNSHERVKTVRNSYLDEI